MYEHHFKRTKYSFEHVTQGLYTGPDLHDANGHIEFTASQGLITIPYSVNVEGNLKLFPNTSLFVDGDLHVGRTLESQLDVVVTGNLVVDGYSHVTKNLVVHGHGTFGNGLKSGGSVNIGLDINMSGPCIVRGQLQWGGRFNVVQVIRAKEGIVFGGGDIVTTIKLRNSRRMSLDLTCPTIERDYLE